MNLRRFSGAALLAASAGLLISGQSCSVVVNDFKVQCNTTQDCIDLANRQPKLPNGQPSVSGLVCSDKHVCEPESGCHTNAECQDAHNGDPYICRASDRTCQSLILTSATDPTKHICDVLASPDDLRNENTIYIGASVFFKDDSNQGLELVREDFNNLASGLPPASATSTARRPLAFVYCEATDTLDEGATHLINDLELPIVITSVDTTSDIHLLNNYTLENHVFQLSTSAGGATLKGIDNMGLLIDLVLINQNYDKETTGLVTNYYTPLLQDAGGPLGATDKPRVAVIHSSTPTASGTGSSIVTALQAAGAQAEDFGYGDSNNPSGDPAAYASVVSQVLGFKPHVIIILGDAEIGPDATTGSPGIDVPIEQGWAAAAPGQPPPQWLAILGSVGQLPTDINTVDLPARLDWGSRSLFIQQHYDFNSPQFTSYIAQLKQLLQGNDPDGIVALEMTSPFNEFLREGAYLTAYSIALLGAQGLPLTGPNVAAAARSFGSQDSAKFTIGKDNIFPALQSIASTKQPFWLDNFQGWVGFDDHGFAKYTFADDVDCLTPDVDPTSNEAIVGALQATGAVFETTGMQTGSVSLSGCVTNN